MTFTTPVPELPVPDVRKAQEKYRDLLGFTIGWHDANGRIGAVSRDDCAIFFRESDAPAAPAVFWMFTEDVDGTHADLQSRGAEIVEPPADKPWGLRQFTLRDPYGNLFHVHCDI